MKVFVYSKSDSRKLAEFKDVEGVRHVGDEIIFYMKDGIRVSFDTHLVKTTSYQN